MTAIYTFDEYIRLPLLFDYCNMTALYRSRITSANKELFTELGPYHKRNPIPEDFTDRTQFVDVNDLGGFIPYNVQLDFATLIRERAVIKADTAAREKSIGDNWVRLTHFMAHVRIQPAPVSQPGGMAPTGIHNTPNDYKLASVDDTRAYNTLTDSIYDAIIADNPNPADVATPRYVHSIKQYAVTMLEWEAVIQNVQEHYNACVDSIALITQNVHDNDTAISTSIVTLTETVKMITIPSHFTKESSIYGDLPLHGKPIRPGTAGSVLNDVSLPTTLISIVLRDPNMLSNVCYNISLKRYGFPDVINGDLRITKPMKSLSTLYDTGDKLRRNLQIMSVYTNHVHTVLDQLKSQQIKYKP